MLGGVAFLSYEEGLKVAVAMLRLTSGWRPLSWVQKSGKRGKAEVAHPVRLFACKATVGKRGHRRTALTFCRRYMTSTNSANSIQPVISQADGCTSNLTTHGM
jgi:hypothetical protein